MKKQLILSLLILLIIYTNQTVSSLDNDYIQSIYMNETIFIGKMDGSVSEYSKNGDKQDEYSLEISGHNSIVDITKVDKQLILVSEYGYVEFINYTSNELIYRFSIENIEIKMIEYMGDNKLIMGTSMRMLYTFNITNYQIIDIIDMIDRQGNIEYNKDIKPNDCVNCGFIDMQYTDYLYVIYGNAVYTIDIDNMIVIRSYSLSSLSPVGISVENGIAIHYNNKIIDMFPDKKFSSYRDRISVNVDRDVQSLYYSDGLLVNFGDEIGYFKDDLWVYITLNIHISDVMITDNKYPILLFSVDFENYMMYLSIDDFQPHPLFSDIELFLFSMFISIIILLVLYRKYRDFISTKIIMIKNTVIARRKGFSTIEEFMNARDRGFYDRWMMERIIRMGYRTYDAYLSALKTARNDGIKSMPSNDRSTDIYYNDTEITYNHNLMDKYNLKYLYIFIPVITIAYLIVNFFIYLLSVIIINLVIQLIISLIMRIMGKLNQNKNIIIIFTLVIVISSVPQIPGEIIIDDYIMGGIAYDNGDYFIYQNNSNILQRLSDSKLSDLRSYDSQIFGVIVNEYGSHIITIDGYIDEYYTGQRWNITIDSILDIEITAKNFIIADSDITFINKRNTSDTYIIDKLPLNLANYCVNCLIIDLEVENKTYALSDGSIIYQVSPNGIDRYFSIEEKEQTPITMSINNKYIAIIYTGGHLRIYSTNGILLMKKEFFIPISDIEWNDNNLAIGLPDGSVSIYTFIDNNLQIIEEYKQNLPGYVVDHIDYHDNLIVYYTNNKLINLSVSKNNWNTSLILLFMEITIIVINILRRQKIIILDTQP